MRTATIQRDTRETQIRLSLDLDGAGKADVATGCGFLDHMLELFARHGDLDLTVTCRGDTQVDFHHSVEDVRYGQSLLPMDEALVLCACDLSGRDHLGWAVDLPAAKVGDLDTELIREFWLGFVRNCPGSIHIRQLAGENTHHILEAIFKGMGRMLKAAVRLDPKHLHEVPSTKGVL